MYQFYMWFRNDLHCLICHICKCNPKLLHEYDAINIKENYWNYFAPYNFLKCKAYFRRGKECSLKSVKICQIFYKCSKFQANIFQFGCSILTKHFEISLSTFRFASTRGFLFHFSRVRKLSLQLLCNKNL